MPELVNFGCFLKIRLRLTLKMKALVLQKGAEINKFIYHPVILSEIPIPTLNSDNDDVLIRLQAISFEKI